MRKEVERIACLGDDGNQYTVLIYQNFRQWRGLNESSWIPTTKEAMLPNGDPVNHVDDDTYKLVLDDVTLSRVE